MGFLAELAERRGARNRSAKANILRPIAGRRSVEAIPALRNAGTQALHAVFDF